MPRRCCSRRSRPRIEAGVAPEAAQGGSSAGVGGQSLPEPEPEPSSQLEAPEPEPEVVFPTPPVTDPAWGAEFGAEPVLTNATDSFILGQIAALVAPGLVAKVDALEAENQQLRARLDEVEGEFDAFLELAASRRKRED